MDAMAREGKGVEDTVEKVLFDGSGIVDLE